MRWFFDFANDDRDSVYDTYDSPFDDLTDEEYCEYLELYSKDAVHA